jgi:hypothetical protein
MQASCSFPFSIFGKDLRTPTEVEKPNATTWCFERGIRSTRTSHDPTASDASTSLVCLSDPDESAFLTFDNGNAWSSFVVRFLERNTFPQPDYDWLKGPHRSPVATEVASDFRLPSLSWSYAVFVIYCWVVSKNHDIIISYV